MENQFLFQMRADEAIEAIAQRVIELLNSSKQAEEETSKKVLEDPITTNEVCSLLRVTRVTVDAWRKKGLIPYHRKGARVFYYRSEILESLEKPWGAHRWRERRLST